MDGGLATAAAAAVDVSRVDAAEADATGPDASRADASQASSGGETGLAASVAALLPKLQRIADEECLSRKAQAEAAEDARLEKLIYMCLAADGIIAPALLSVVSGARATITVVVLAMLMALGCLAALIYMGRRRGPREATDLESGGGWFWACRRWDGGTNGSRRMRVCIYSSTRGRYGSSRLGA
jgi:hypothetical protein